MRTLVIGDPAVFLGKEYSRHDVAIVLAAMEGVLELNAARAAFAEWPPQTARAEGSMLPSPAEG
jgi:hypothetical protein